MVFLGFISLIIRELTYIPAFHKRNFPLGCVYSFKLGMGLYNAVYLLQLFLFLNRRV